MKMKLLTVVVLVAIFSGAHSVASTEDINEAKTKVLSWFNKVESSLNSGVQKLSTDFAEKLQTTSSDIRKRFEEQKQKFADSEYASKLAELGDSLAEKQVKISKEVEKTLAKASVEVQQQMEETKEHLKGMSSEGKEHLLKWIAETEKKVNVGVKKLSEDFTAQLETTRRDLREKFDEQKKKFEKSEYAGKLSELSDTLKVKHEEIAKDVVKTIARVSEDVKVQMDQAKEHINNIKIWMQEEL